MSSRNLAKPIFPLAPRDYSREYMDRLVQSFSVYLEQYQNPGESRSTKTVMTSVPSSPANLEDGTVWADSTILRIGSGGTPGSFEIPNLEVTTLLDVSGTLDITGTFDIAGTTVTASALELNYNDITTLGTVEENKTVTAGTGKAIDFNDAPMTNVDINSGEIDGTPIGVTVPSTGSFTNLTATGTSTLTTVDINGGNIDGTIIGASVPAALAATTGNFSDDLTVDDSIFFNGSSGSDGELYWDGAAETLSLTMGDSVIQQIGFETYMRCRNSTGSTIGNGVVVGFSGVSTEITIAPYVANSSANELYFIGVTTFSMANGATGPVTLYGKVRGLNTTGPGAESWSVGDVLYVSPTTAGSLTNIRPTAPNAVIAVAAVLSVDSTNGEIMVRPSVPIGFDYGYFSSTSTQSLGAANTETAITLNATGSANGVSIGSPTSRLVVSQAGEYQVNASFQLTSKSASDKNVFFWIRKNGSDVSNTTRAITVNINNGYSAISVSYPILLDASDYIELYWAADSTDVDLEPISASGFAPAAPSVIVSVTQDQL